MSTTEQYKIKLAKRKSFLSNTKSVSTFYYKKYKTFNIVCNNIKFLKRGRQI